MRKIFKLTLFLIFLSLFFSTGANYAHAKYRCMAGGGLLYDTINDCLSSGCLPADCVSVPDSTSGGTVSLNNPLTGTASSDTVPTLLGKIVLAVMGVVGSIALVMFIYGGFTWMTAAGNAEAVTKGRNIIIWAAIGLIVIFSAYALVNFIIFTGLNAPTTK